MKTNHSLMNKGIFLLLLLFAILEIILIVDTKGIYDVPAAAESILRFILLAAVYYLAVSLLIRLTVDRFAGYFGSDLEIEQRIFLTKMYTFVLYTVATFMVLSQFGLSLDNITLIIGLIATGLAFTIRDVLLSFFVWFILLHKKPFRIGDYIRMGDDKGIVIHIGTFFVLLDDTPDSQSDYTKIPNKLFLEKPVHNFGKDNVMEELHFPLKSVPKNIHAQMKKLKARLEKQVTSVMLELDIEDDVFYLVIVFRAPMSVMQEKKTWIIAEAADSLREVIRSVP